MARIIHDGNTVPLTLEELKAMKPGDIMYMVEPTKTYALKVNGQPKTWVTRPNEVQVPYKYGLYDHGYITHNDLRRGTIRRMA